MLLSQDAAPAVRNPAPLPHHAPQTESLLLHELRPRLRLLRHGAEPRVQGRTDRHCSFEIQAGAPFVIH